ncbi:hypothetical protein Megpolyxen_01384 [Candidatus Megaera polyxenophila]|nr:hypothetical protein Megpolyxen_01384 [Candidatus Megaera polyxenophila]
MSWGVFIIAIICLYYFVNIITTIDQSIVRLQNVVNSLDERVRKLEDHVFYTWDPHSDE